MAACFGGASPPLKVAASREAGPHDAGGAGVRDGASSSDGGSSIGGSRRSDAADGLERLLASGLRRPRGDAERRLLVKRPWCDSLHTGSERNPHVPPTLRTYFSRPGALREEVAPSSTAASSSSSPAMWSAVTTPLREERPVGFTSRILPGELSDEEASEGAGSPAARAPACGRSSSSGVLQRPARVGPAELDRITARLYAGVAPRHGAGSPAREARGARPAPSPSPAPHIAFGKRFDALPLGRPWRNERGASPRIAARSPPRSPRHDGTSGAERVGGEGLSPPKAVKGPWQPERLHEPEDCCGRHSDGEAEEPEVAGREQGRTGRPAPDGRRGSVAMNEALSITPSRVSALRSAILLLECEGGGASGGEEGGTCADGGGGARRRGSGGAPANGRGDAAGSTDAEESGVDGDGRASAPLRPGEASGVARNADCGGSGCSSTPGLGGLAKQPEVTGGGMRGAQDAAATAAGGRGVARIQPGEAPPPGLPRAGGRGVGRGRGRGGASPRRALLATEAAAEGKRRLDAVAVVAAAGRGAVGPRCSTAATVADGVAGGAISTASEGGNAGSPAVASSGMASTGAVVRGHGSCVVGGACVGSSIGGGGAGSGDGAGGVGCNGAGGVGAGGAGGAAGDAGVGDGVGGGVSAGDGAGQAGVGVGADGDGAGGGVDGGGAGSGSIVAAAPIAGLLAAAFPGGSLVGAPDGTWSPFLASAEEVSRRRHSISVDGRLLRGPGLQLTAPEPLPPARACQDPSRERAATDGETAKAGVEKTPKKGAAPPPKKGAGKGKGPAPSPKAKALAKEAAVEPRKPLVKPGVAVKRLFWSPMFLNAEGDTVWHAIDQEGAAIDTAELEFLFAEKGALGPRTAASPHGQDPPAATKLRVLDEPRRRSVCVMLARLPPARETVAAVSGLAEAALDRDQVELLLMNLPPIEERNMLKAAREAAATPELSAWDTAEQFLLLLIEVPRYEQRLRVWGFECSYAERLADLAGAEAELRAGCEVVLRSVALQHLLGLALFAGNFLNGGTTRGRADGFALEALCQLRTIKTSQADRGDTLVDYIVQQMERKYPGELSSAFASGGEAETVSRASRRHLCDLTAEVQALRQQAAAMARSARVAAAEDDVLARHAEVLALCCAEAEALALQVERLRLIWQDLCKWFHIEFEGPSKKTTEVFFGIWAGYLRDVQRAREAMEARERQHRQQQLRRRPRQARPQAEAPPSGEAPPSRPADPPSVEGAAAETPALDEAHSGSRAERSPRSEAAEASHDAQQAAETTDSDTEEEEDQVANLREARAVEVVGRTRSWSQPEFRPRTRLMKRFSFIDIPGATLDATVQAAEELLDTSGAEPGYTATQSEPVMARRLTMAACELLNAASWAAEQAEEGDESGDGAQEQESDG